MQVCTLAAGEGVLHHANRACWGDLHTFLYCPYHMVTLCVSSLHYLSLYVLPFLTFPLLSTFELSLHLSSCHVIHPALSQPSLSHTLFIPHSTSTLSIIPLLSLTVIIALHNSSIYDPSNIILPILSLFLLSLLLFPALVNPLSVIPRSVISPLYYPSFYYSSVIIPLSIILPSIILPFLIPLSIFLPCYLTLHYHYFFCPIICLLSSLPSIYPLYIIPLSVYFSLNYPSYIISFSFQPSFLSFSLLFLSIIPPLSSFPL
jgi:hypothetical protein